MLRLALLQRAKHAHSALLSTVKTIFKNTHAHLDPLRPGKNPSNRNGGPLSGTHHPAPDRNNREILLVITLNLAHNAKKDQKPANFNGSADAPFC